MTTDKVASQDAVRALVELADEYAGLMSTYDYWAPRSDVIAMGHKDRCDTKRSDLESAIRAALQASRSVALEDAAKACDSYHQAIPEGAISVGSMGKVVAAIDCANTIRALAAKDGR